MYKVDFYRNANGESELLNFIDGLHDKLKTSKDARIQYNQILYYIDLLEKNGTRLPETVTKPLGDDLWELRPGVNRVIYFYHKDNIFVLLHHFRKKSMKTPRRELEKAKAERNDYLSRKGGK